jgi:transcription termination factor Rho
MEEDTILSVQSGIGSTLKDAATEAPERKETPKPRARRGRPRKKVQPIEDMHQEVLSEPVVDKEEQKAAPKKPTRRRRTTKKETKPSEAKKPRVAAKKDDVAHSTTAAKTTKRSTHKEKVPDTSTPTQSVLFPEKSETSELAVAPVTKPISKKIKSPAHSQSGEASVHAQESGLLQTDAKEVSSQKDKPQKKERSTELLDKAQHEISVPTPETDVHQDTESSHQTDRHELSAPSARSVAQHDATSQQYDNERVSHRRRHVNREYGNAPSSGNNNNNRGHHGRRKTVQERSAEPSLTREALAEMKVVDLRSKAAALDVDYLGMRKKDLIEVIYKASAESEGFLPVEGILQMQPEGYAFLRSGNFTAGDDDAFVHQQLIRQYSLRSGDRIKGTVGPARSGNKFPPLQNIESINGKSPEQIKHRPRFRDLTPIYPNERLVMEHGKDSITGRAIDLVAPIGKGQRGLIVSPPKAGKTTVLKKICQSIAANNPEVHLFCLLVDERPEEVTDMERSIKGDVVASTFDMPASNHTAVAEMVIEHAKRLVELGEDVVVVLDSITRLARAYNLAQPASGRILSGGVDSAALYPPKKFLGAARNIEGGGSLTILASALVDTGSKMDEVIFEEFKGTGNMELKLDRDLADRRIFPAIDPVSSGTRNEDLLLDAELTPFVWGIRRILANMNNTERAATALVRGLKQTNTNKEFLIRSAKKAQQSDYVS